MRKFIKTFKTAWALRNVNYLVVHRVRYEELTDIEHRWNKLKEECRKVDEANNKIREAIEAEREINEAIF